MLDALEHVLMTVSDDLRFAETKNAALLTANAAAVIAIGQLFVSHPHLGAWPAAYLTAVGLAGTVSGILGLISFVPGVRPRPPRPHQVPGPADNLLYFAHIRKYDGASYLTTMSAAMDAAGARTPLERMYADQIVASARIADRKFTLFRYAVWITITGLTTPLVALLLWYAAHRPSLSLRRRPARAVPEPAPDGGTQPTPA
jgi:hypothetical protein